MPSETSRYDSYTDFVSELFINHRAENNVGIFVCLLLDQTRRLMNFIERHIQTAGDVD